jgi:hypothetical protein
MINLNIFRGVPKFWNVLIIVKKKIQKTSIHRIPLRSNVYKF